MIGIAAGVICFWGATSLKYMLGYDDSLDAFGVHGVGGIVGAILTGVFARRRSAATPRRLDRRQQRSGPIQVYGIAAPWPTTRSPPSSC